MGAGGSSPRVKRQGNEAKHSPQSSVEVKDEQWPCYPLRLHGEVLSKLSTDFFLNLRKTVSVDTIVPLGRLSKAKYIMS
jgi:hypothetical protein